MLFCPKCFNVYKGVSQVCEFNNFFQCLECSEKYPLNSTLISENTIRTFAELYPEHKERLLVELKNV